MKFNELYDILESFFILEDISTRIPFLLNKYKNQTEQSILQLSDADPTPNKKYIDWIIKNSNQFRIPEDINKIKATLDKFKQQTQTSKWQGSKDLNSYKSYKELVQQIETNSDITNMEPMTDEDWQDQHKIKEHGRYKLYKVTSAKAIKKIAEGTEWCVREEPYASDYLKKGPYFVIYEQGDEEIIYKDTNGNPSPDNYSHKIHPNPTPIILIHFPTAQIKDEYDSEIEADAASAVYPLIQNSFKYAKFNFEEGIGDFEIFLVKNIAKGTDKEVLEKFYEPQKAFNILYKTKKIASIGSLDKRELKKSISKSSNLTYKYLTTIMSLHTQNRDIGMEKILIEHSNELYTLAYAYYLTHTALYDLSIYKVSEANSYKLNQILSVYYYSNFKDEFIKDFCVKHDLPLMDILMNVLTNTNLKTLFDIRQHIAQIADKYAEPIFKLYHTIS